MKSLFLTALALTLTASAQTTVKDSLAKHWKTSADLTLAVAQAMPAADYTFRPVPAEMSFGQLMAHIAAADIGACAVASGLERPALPPKIAAWAKSSDKLGVEKDDALAVLHQAFDFCEKAVAQTPADRLTKIVGPARRNLTAFEWFWAYFTHTAHHRGQAEVYLRLKGITPPEYEF